MSVVSVHSSDVTARFGRVRALVELGRPKVVALVLFTAPPVLVAEGAAWPRAGAALLGTALLASGCSAANAVWERHSDARMARTRGRPLPSGRIAPAEAAAFAALELGASLALLTALGGALALAIGIGTAAVYLGLYTAWLKPRSAWQVPVGAVAGAAAPLVADSADGALGALGLPLFALVAAWQLPHAWAIGLFRREEYAAACVPTLPEVAGEGLTRAVVVLSSAALIPVSLIPVALGEAGLAYAVVAGLAGAWLVGRAGFAAFTGRRRDDRATFLASVAHLTLVFGALWAELWLR